jgi:hypothetical protein
MPDPVDLLSGRGVRGDLVCMLCARTLGSAQGPNARQVTPTSIRALDSRHADVVCRLRCPYCAGRLWLQDAEQVYADRPVTSEELHPHRGRHRATTRAS